MDVILGYNTSGFAHHRLDDALAVLAAVGYRGVALTLDYHALDPFAPHFDDDLRRVRDRLHELGLRATVETGARFLLDPWRKHQPTLLDPDTELRGRRRDFLRRAIRAAAVLDADSVSFWSGAPPAAESAEALMDRLAEECRGLCRFADEHGVRLAFEPEPGMFIDTMPKFAALSERVGHPRFGLTLDIGHLVCTGELPFAPHVRRWRDVLWNVHIEDMRAGVHDHLMFGEGEVDFRLVRDGLAEVGYAGPVHVELSRHSHDAVAAARRSFAFLTAHGFTQG